jgi:hypothetical protein
MIEAERGILTAADPEVAATAGARDAGDEEG